MKKPAGNDGLFLVQTGMVYQKVRAISEPSRFPD